MAQKTISTKNIREHNPCYDPTRHLPEDWSGTITEFLKQEQIPAVDRLWVAKFYCSDSTNRLFACWCAEQSFALQESIGNTVDQRSIAAVQVARRFAIGLASEEELSAAWSAARAARSAAWSAAESAAWSAAASAAESAAGSAAESAAGSAAESAAGSAAESAAGSAARSAARSAAEEAQVNELIRLVTEIGE